VCVWVALAQTTACANSPPPDIDDAGVPAFCRNPCIMEQTKCVDQAGVLDAAGLVLDANAAAGLKAMCTGSGPACMSQLQTLTSDRALLQTCCSTSTTPIPAVCLDDDDNDSPPSNCNAACAARWGLMWSQCGAQILTLLAANPAQQQTAIEFNTFGQMCITAMNGGGH
jgi:hypothetical protein